MTTASDHRRPQEGDHRHGRRQERGPALLEDRLRAHPLISQALVVGDAQPFIAALITIDPGGLPRVEDPQRQGRWSFRRRPGRDPDLTAEVELAVKEANQRCRMPSRSASSASCGRLHRGHRRTHPDAEVKRKVVAEKFASDIEALYSKG